MHKRAHTLSARALSIACGLGMTILFAGCETTQSTGASDETAGRPAQVRPLNYGAATAKVDRDRIALSRLVGAWDFEGTYTPAGEGPRQASGIASGTIEQDFFIMLDTARLVSQGNTIEYITGAMLFGVEPGNGLVLTAWSADDPSVRRYKGRVLDEGSRFEFDGIRTPRASGPLRTVIRFETDDRWVMEFSRHAGGASDVLASYTFSRAD